MVLRKASFERNEEKLGNQDPDLYFKRNICKYYLPQLIMQTNIDIKSGLAPGQPQELDPRRRDFAAMREVVKGVQAFLVTGRHR
ncbi:hypothetical protein HUJ04_005210 [Dendroctonus ponderosae]|nr:hypothetical protein HUJ04_005210 [Dendroctonus ponderosae]